MTCAACNFFLCLLAFSFTAISLAATLVWVSHGTSCHAHFVGSRLLGFLVNLCAAVIIAVVAVAAATVALYKVATNNWPDTQATSVYLTLFFLFFFRSVSFSRTHTLTHSCKNMRPSGNHRLPLLIIVIVAAAAVLQLATATGNCCYDTGTPTAHRPLPLTPRPSECLKIHCTFKIEVQMLRNPHAKNARRSCMRELTQKRRHAAKSLSPANRQ